MKKIIFLLLFTTLFADSPFESPKSKSFDMSAYETKKSVENEEASQNPRIKCRWVCDKKIYTQQKIADAISFYKNSKDYSFK
ncbi:MAG: hypothetical protein U9Q29_04170 [Campylobacterota bacterium]|nr:hypothetical protein [Campylobacterota bacterium]